jgi:hypothetical protein
MHSAQDVTFSMARTPKKQYYLGWPAQDGASFKLAPDRSIKPRILVL